MRTKFRTMVSTLILLLMFTVFTISVSAATQTVTSYRNAQFRGNGTYSGSGVSGEDIAIGKNQTVRFTARLEMLVDPHTEERKISAYVAFRCPTWYGYSTLSSSDLMDSEGIFNRTDSFLLYTRASTSSFSTDATKDYYIYAKTTGASSAYYSDYSFTVQYTVGA